MNKEYITDYKARLEKGLAEFMELPITVFGGGLLFFVAVAKQPIYGNIVCVADFIQLCHVGLVSPGFPLCWEVWRNPYFL